MVVFLATIPNQPCGINVEIYSLGSLSTASNASKFSTVSVSSLHLNNKICQVGPTEPTSIGRIIANTAVANAKAVAAFPVTFGQPFVTINTISAALGIASTIAGAAKSISQINSSQNATSAAGSGGSLPKSGASSVPTPTLQSASAPVIQGTQAATPGAQIADTLAGVTGRPVRAYVVSGDVSSQQALDRRTSNAATFGG